MKKTRILALAAMATMMSVNSYAQEAETNATDETTEVEEADVVETEEDEYFKTDSINGQTGTIKMSGMDYSIELPKGYQWLDKYKAGHLMTDYWNNEKDNDMLGVIATDKAKIFYDVDVAYVVYYDEVGYVDESDADKMDPAKVMAMAEEADDKMKGKEWVVKPCYDKKLHMLEYCRRMECRSEVNSEEGEEVIYESMKYVMMVYGKKGLVTIQAVGDMEDYDKVKAAKNAIASSVKFDEGARYGDFDASKDKRGDYTIGAIGTEDNTRSNRYKDIWLYGGLSVALLVVIVAFIIIVKRRKNDEESNTK